ncbi:MAG: amidohydrolase family protein [Pseudolysinimonas sp.]
MSSLIDSHVHVWDPQVNEYGWLEGVLDRPYLPAEYHAAAPEVTGVIFVQADARDGLAEARWVSELDWPELLGIVAHAPLELGGGVAAYLDEVRGVNKVVGIRRLLQDEPLAFFESDALRAGLATLAGSGLVFDACVRTGQVSALTRLLASVPELPVVLDHLGKPPVAAGDDGSWERDLRELAALPQVRVKLSGMAPEAAPAELLGQVRPWLETALDAFGAERCMVGSDWPVSAVTSHGQSPGAWIDLVLDDLGAAPAEREQLAWRTAAAFYGVASDPVAPDAVTR